MSLGMSLEQPGTVGAVPAMALEWDGISDPCLLPLSHFPAPSPFSPGFISIIPGQQQFPQDGLGVGMELWRGRAPHTE